MAELAIKQTEITAEDKVFNKNKWIFSVSGIGRDMAYQLIASFLLVYIQFGVTLNAIEFATLSIIIGVGGRIWDAINDPMMGAIIEGTHMKFGKFKPWILFGAVGCGAVIITMFNVQMLEHWNFVIFMSVMYLLWESTFTMNDIGYWSMLPSLSSKKKQRDQATMLTVLFAGVGAIIAQGIISPLTTGNMRAGYRWLSIAIALVFVIAQIICAFFVKERKRTEVEQKEKISLKKMFSTIKNNDQLLWATLSHLLYSIGSALLMALAANMVYSEIAYNGTYYFYLVVAYGVPSVLVNALYPALANKLGRKKLQKLAICVAAAGYFGVACLGWVAMGDFVFIILMCICAAVISCGQSLFYMANIVNMTNCVEYNDYKQGERNEAVVSTLRPFTAKMSAALQTLIVTIALIITGIYGMSQSVSALEAQKSFFGYIEDSATQAAYIDEVNGYIARLDNGEDVEAEIQQSEYQLSAETVKAIGDAVILRTDANNVQIAVGRVKDLSDYVFDDAYTYSLEVGDLAESVDVTALGDNTDSAADLNFHDEVQDNLAARIGLRIVVTGLPVLFLVGALIIIDKKFIIDEKFYAEMMEKIAERDGNAQTEETTEQE